MPTGVLTGVRQVGRLQDRQRVHVGAQADRALAVAVAEHADHAGLADAAMHLDAPFLQLLGDQFGGAVLFQAELRVGVDVAADGGQFRLVAAGTVERGVGHRAGSLSETVWTGVYHAAPAWPAAWADSDCAFWQFALGDRRVECNPIGDRIVVEIV